MLLLPSRRVVGAVVISTCLAVAGCGGAAPQSRTPMSTGSFPAESARTSHVSTSAPSEEVAKPDDAKRIILYSATVEVVVKDLDAAAVEVAKLVEQQKGYIAASEVRGNIGSVRLATYTIRVPVGNFSTLKNAFLALGVPERDMLKSDDVTEEHIDLQGRLKNLRSTQERLIELKKMASVKEILEIEPQLEKVNEKIEKIEGRIKYLTTFASLSTINLSLREIQDYKPPTAPTFGNQISRTFHSSWEHFLDFLRGLVLLLVALGPWLPLLIPLGLLGLWLFRRSIRRARDLFASAWTSRGENRRNPTE